MLEAIDAGAVGYVLKDAPPEQVIDGIRAAARGDTFLDPPARVRSWHAIPRGGRSRWSPPP